MVTAEFSLARLIFITFCVVTSTGILARAAPVDTTTTAPAPVAFQPTDIFGILKCEIGCFGEQVESSENLNVIAMYNSCLEHCGSEDNMQSLACMVTACQHLAAGYTPSSAADYVRNQYDMCVEASCPLMA
ncbi:hypothetical protein MVEG_01257 [Podila verticillata NRRL 6337]|nr:hypothetical protein MVEG_01257 [Podila verticillata NRRL 6337]